MVRQIIVNYAKELIITTSIIISHLIQKIIYIVTKFSEDNLVGFIIHVKYPWHEREFANSSIEDRCKGLYRSTLKSQQSMEYNFFGISGNILLFKNYIKSHMFSFGGL